MRSVNHGIKINIYKLTTFSKNVTFIFPTHTHTDTNVAVIPASREAHGKAGREPLAPSLHKQLTSNR